VLAPSWQELCHALSRSWTFAFVMRSAFGLLSDGVLDGGEGDVYYWYSHRLEGRDQRDVRT